MIADVHTRSSVTRRERKLPWLLVALAMITLGCSSSPSREPVYPVRGNVVSKDAPATNAIVIFHPAKGSPGFAHSAYARVDEAGEYRLSTYDAFDGAHAGDYAVTVMWPLVTADGEDGPDRLEGRYAHREKSPLRATVLPDTNTIPPFEVR